MPCIGEEIIKIKKINSNFIGEFYSLRTKVKVIFFYFIKIVESFRFPCF